MPGTRNPNAEEHPPSPLPRGEERKRRGDVIPSKGECGAVSHQQTACGMPCRGEPQCSPFFCVVSAISEREFRKWAQINANNCVRHSEHREESRRGKGRDSSLRSE